MYDLGKMHYFLGVKVIQSIDGIYISQKKYVQEVLNKQITGGKVELGSKLKKDPTGGKVDSALYKQIMGSFMY